MPVASEHVRCPDCGTELSSDAEAAGLCPRCLLSLALVGSILDPDLESDDEAPTLQGPSRRWLVEATVAHARTTHTETPTVEERQVNDLSVVPFAHSGGIGVYEGGSDGRN